MLGCPSTPTCIACHPCKMLGGKRADEAPLMGETAESRVGRLLRAECPPFPCYLEAPSGVEGKRLDFIEGPLSCTKLNLLVNRTLSTPSPRDLNSWTGMYGKRWSTRYSTLKQCRTLKDKNSTWISGVIYSCYLAPTMSPATLFCTSCSF